MKKLPIGISTFSEIITGGYCYADKTGFVHRLAEQGPEYCSVRVGEGGGVQGGPLRSVPGLKQYISGFTKRHWV
jgi:hypothetical protein